MTILSGTMRIAIKFAYDGRKFYGYARQPNLKTVEGELIKELVKHSIIEDTKEAIFRSSSRTDKGVSALCNTFAFNTNHFKNDILDKLSDEFQDIIVYGIANVEPYFNPRYAKQRQYRYYLKIDYFNVDKIISTSNVFTGEHNFSNFARIESFKDPVRAVDNIIFTIEDTLLIIDFYAQTFLWHQIRRIISALIKIGSGKLVKEQIRDSLANPNKKVDFGLAPAENLILIDIVYNFDFEYNESQFKKVKKLEKKIISSL